MAASANGSGLLPEQVWDQNPPSGRSGFPSGTPTFSATPLAWTHAQLIRLAWSISTGAPVEQPSVVACRYVRRCTVARDGPFDPSRFPAAALPGAPMR